LHIFAFCFPTIAKFQIVDATIRINFGSTTNSSAEIRASKVQICHATFKKNAPNWERFARLVPHLAACHKPMTWRQTC
jgi:hypothetical protein